MKKKNVKIAINQNNKISKIKSKTNKTSESEKHEKREKFMAFAIYKKLFKAYGRQGWWPLTNNKLSDGRPKHDGHRFEIIVGAILTQGTNWKNVEKAINELNKQNLLDINKISKLPRKKLAMLIKSAGYYNQKAERLKLIANYILKNYKSISKFFNLPTKNLREELLSIKGIGPETADTIILYAADRPSFVIDAYTRRIFSRLKLIDENESYDKIQQFFMQNLPSDADMFKEYHALIVRHAKQYCRKKPLCENCILKKFCNLQN